MSAVLPLLSLSMSMCNNALCLSLLHSKWWIGIKAEVQGSCTLYEECLGRGGAERTVPRSDSKCLGCRGVLGPLLPIVSKPIKTETLHFIKGGGPKNVEMPLLFHWGLEVAISTLMDRCPALYSEWTSPLEYTKVFCFFLLSTKLDRVWGCSYIGRYVTSSILSWHFLLWWFDLVVSSYQCRPAVWDFKVNSALRPV